MRRTVMGLVVVALLTACATTPQGKVADVAIVLTQTTKAIGGLWQQGYISDATLRKAQDAARLCDSALQSAWKAVADGNAPVADEYVAAAKGFLTTLREILMEGETARNLATGGGS